MANPLTKILVSYKSFMDRYAGNRNTVGLVVVTMAVYLYILFVSIPAVTAFAGGMKLFDMMPLGYSAEYARLLLDSLGEEGRRTYLADQIPVDMIYPFLFAVSYSFALSNLFKKAFKEGSWVHWLSFVPVVAGLFDYFENIGIIVMINAYPDVSPGWVGLTCVFSVTKSVATTIFWLLAIVGICGGVKNWLRARKQSPR